MQQAVPTKSDCSKFKANVILSEYEKKDPISVFFGGFSAHKIRWRIPLSDRLWLGALTVTVRSACNHRHLANVIITLTR